MFGVQLFLICAYGVIKEFRPATPFLTPYLVNEPKNFTNNQLYSEIYPFWTYSYMTFLIPIFILTDRLKYKPVVIIEALSLTLTWIMLIYSNTLISMQVMQVVYGKQ